MADKKYVAPLIAVGIVVVVAVGSYFALRRAGDQEKTSGQAPVTQQPGGSQPQADGTAPAPDAAKAPDAAAPTKSVYKNPAVAQAYADALKAYDGRRIQFADNCRAEPENITVKNGTAVMFDNRNATKITMVLDKTSYVIQGYGWRVLTMRGTDLPHTVSVDCTGHPNVAQILIQK